jgi:Cft2 family RNA processing exonuclease
VFTEIYDLVSARAPNLRPDLNLHEALDLQVLEARKVGQLNLKGKLFVITAGMMSEHTMSHELTVRMAPEECHSILFVGYSAPDTPAGALRAAAQGTPFTFSPSAGQLVRHCHMDSFDLTAHANREELVDFAVSMGPRTVILGHGEPEARDWIETELRERLPRLNILQPAPGETLEV